MEESGTGQPGSLDLPWGQVGPDDLKWVPPNTGWSQQDGGQCVRGQPHLALLFPSPTPLI